MTRSNRNPLVSVAAALVVSLLLGGCAVFRPGLVDCAVNCSIDITLPSDAQRAPTVGDPYVRVKPGSQVEFRAAQDVFVVFPDDTPFEDASGNPLYWFRFTGSTTVTARNDRSSDCVYWNGCKYMVFDGSNPRRPVLDPYIIIDR